MNRASRRRMIGLALGLAAAGSIGPALAEDDAAWADIRDYLFPE